MIVFKNPEGIPDASLPAPNARSRPNAPGKLKIAPKSNQDRPKIDPRFALLQEYHSAAIGIDPEIPHPVAICRAGMVSSPLTVGW
jgi:hypothetical protein